MTANFVYAYSPNFKCPNIRRLNMVEKLNEQLAKCKTADNPLEALSVFTLPSGLNIQIGKLGGREIKSKVVTIEKNVYVKDIIKVFKDIVQEGQNLNLDAINLCKTIFQHVKELDAAIVAKLEQCNIIVRILAAIRSFFSTIFFNNNKNLNEIEKVYTTKEVVLLAEKKKADEEAAVAAAAARKRAEEEAARKRLEDEAAAAAARKRLEDEAAAAAARKKAEDAAGGGKKK